jgi:PIN domain nuclease of toxin-antitoxin system
MVVLDAAALIAVMKDEPAAEGVGELLGGSTAMSSVNYCEVVDHLLRVVGVDRDWIDVQMAPVVHSSLDIIAMHANTAARAAQVRARFYDSQRRPISLADSFAIATALALRAPLATSDRLVTEILRELDHDVVPLPNSRGEWPR